MEFSDALTGEKVILRNTEGREKRIVGLGQYYRDKDLSAGDEIIFERSENKDGVKYLLYVKKRNDSLVFQKMKYGFEILTPEQMRKFENIGKRQPELFDIRFIEAARKRNDSPETTDFYDISLNGISLLDSYAGKEIGILQRVENEVQKVDFYGWKKYVFETEES